MPITIPPVSAVDPTIDQEGARLVKWIKTWLHPRGKRRKPVRQAPERIRTAARWCIVSASASIIVGFVTRWNTPTFKGDAYTEIVERITSVYGAIAWLAAVVLLVSAAVLRALADILDELRQRPIEAGSESPGQQ